MPKVATRPSLFPKMYSRKTLEENLNTQTENLNNTKTLLIKVLFNNCFYFSDFNISIDMS